MLVQMNARLAKTFSVDAVATCEVAFFSSITFIRLSVL